MEQLQPTRIAGFNPQSKIGKIIGLSCFFLVIIIFLVLINKLFTEPTAKQKHKKQKWKTLVFFDF